MAIISAIIMLIKEGKIITIIWEKPIITTFQGGQIITIISEGPIITTFQGGQIITIISEGPIITTFQGGHKRNGSYEGVDSNEPQPPLVKIMMRIRMRMNDGEDYMKTISVGAHWVQTFPEL